MFSFRFGTGMASELAEKSDDDDDDVDDDDENDDDDDDDDVVGNMFPHPPFLIKPRLFSPGVILGEL